MEVIINVMEYGADPAGICDSTEAVRKAFEAAKGIGGRKTVLFPKGEYHFYKESAQIKKYPTSNTSSVLYPDKWVSVLVEGQEDLLIDGNGSKWVMHGDVMALAVVNCQNINLMNFSVDYNDPDTVDITVIAHGTERGRDYTDFYIPPNNNYRISSDGKHIVWQGDTDSKTGVPYWTAKDTMDAYLVIFKCYDETVRRHEEKRRDGRKTADPFLDVDSICEISDRTLRFQYRKSRPEYQELGNVYLLCDSRTRKTAGVFFWESVQILVEHVQVHYLSNFGCLIQMCKDVTLDAVSFVPRKGSARLTTSNADQVHAAGVGGSLIIKDCVFSISHDDAINIHGTYMRVEEVIDERTLRMRYVHRQQGGFRQFHPEDEVIFYSRVSLKPPLGKEEAETFRVKRSYAPGDRYQGKECDHFTEIVEFELPFSREMLEEFQVKIHINTIGCEEESTVYVAENITYTADVWIKGCRMKSIPTRGILCTSRKSVVIEDNILENMSMASIYISNDAVYWYESGPVRDMKIRRNRFYIRFSGQDEWADAPAVYIDPVRITDLDWSYTGNRTLKQASDSTTIHQNISVTDNCFYMEHDNVVTATGVDGLKITHNHILPGRPLASVRISEESVFLKKGEKRKLTAAVISGKLPKDVFVLRECRNVLIEDNRYADGINRHTAIQGMNESEVCGNENAREETDTDKSIGGRLYYRSFHPDIVAVDEEGNLTGLQDTGTAYIAAYYKEGGHVVRSNIVQVNACNQEGECSIRSADSEISGLACCHFEDVELKRIKNGADCYFGVWNQAQKYVRLHIKVPACWSDINVFRRTLDGECGLIQECKHNVTLEIAVEYGINIYEIEWADLYGYKETVNVYLFHPRPSTHSS